MKSCLAFFDKLRWIDGRPLKGLLEPYRRRLFARFFDERRDDGTLKHNLGLFGRGKKNWKSADLVLGALWALLEPTPGRHEVLLVAFDEDQAATDLDLLKQIVRANPKLEEGLSVQQNVILRKDGRGFVKVLPGQSAAGEHGRTYRFLGIDEIHAQRNWDLLEALQPDPTRANAQVWICSYASLFHKPGVPLHDLTQMGKSGRDPRMLFSWYAADHCTDPDFVDLEPELRANPSIGSWPEGRAYLEQQKLRLPAHKFRRLHLNLPGLPEGSAFQPDPIMNAIARGVSSWACQASVEYRAFVDMSGGSSDDAVLAIGHVSQDGLGVIDRVLSQGQAPPFNPSKAVERFVAVLREYGCSGVTGDRYAGETFKTQFEDQGITYHVADRPKSQLYEAMEPHLNGRRVVLPDVPEVEQQLLGLVWRGGRIDHLSGEHDDWANAVAGCAFELLSVKGIRRIEDLFFEKDITPQSRLETIERESKQVAEQIQRTCAKQGFWFPGD